MSVASEVTQARVTEALKVGAETYEGELEMGSQVSMLLAGLELTRYVLRDAASIYKVDADAIALKVKQEFAAKEKARKPSNRLRPKRQI
ncbi:hypothetical protein [Tunturiibacter gelidiferens]|uniref:hypothetical protein n=1 Tax=Tunturiibacter gelidiferens TaxID=3069689 RepID=UPI003D9B3BBA